ncbi:MAG TPA: hypothetical protein VEK31_02660 [Xanthobacteraceae bacterium]|nr:hypothetical protein [Xanthobacteraceae bacterium]
MIEAFAEHVDLDDPIERPFAQRRQDLGLLLLCLLAVEDLSTEPALPVERSDIPCMINRAGDGYKLLLSAALPVDDFLPASSGAVMRFVDNDHVEEVVRKLSQPLVDVGGKLLHVRDNDVRFGCDRNIAAIQRAG